MNCHLLNKHTSVTFPIRHMKVSVWPVRRAGSKGVYGRKLGSLAGSLREATLHFIVLLTVIREKKSNVQMISFQLM